MVTKIYWINTSGNAAKLGIMPRPRGNEWLEKEISSLKQQEVGVLVSLLERSEIKELELEQEEALCTKYNIDFINYPIPDRGIPNSTTGVARLREQLRTKLSEGRSVVIHCRMGIGRSSIIAACIMLKEGWRVDNIIAHISKVRGLRVPDTDKQVQWLREQK